MSLDLKIVSLCPFRVPKIFMPTFSVSRAKRWLSCSLLLDSPNLSVPLSRRDLWSTVEASKSPSPDSKPPNNSSRLLDDGTWVVARRYQKQFSAVSQHIHQSTTVSLHTKSLLIFSNSDLKSLSFVWRRVREAVGILRISISICAICRKQHWVLSKPEVLNVLMCSYNFIGFVNFSLSSTHSSLSVLWKSSQLSTFGSSPPSLVALAKLPPPWLGICLSILLRILSQIVLKSCS